MKNNKYKVILSNNNIYKEVDLPNDAAQYRIGTGIDSDYRLRKEMFFGELSLDFYNNNGEWRVACSESTYITAGDSRRLLTVELHHGDSYFVKYQDSGVDAVRIDYTVDFESENKKFDRIIDLPDSSMISLGAGAGKNIVLNSRYVKDDNVELHKESDKLRLVVKQTTFGVYKNGNKVDGEEIIKDTDFFAISDFSFYYRNGKLLTEASERLTVNGLNYTDNKIDAIYPLFIRNTRTKYSVNEEDINLLVPNAVPTEPEQNLALTLMPALVMLVLTVVLRGFMSNMSNKSYILFSVCSMSMGIFTSIATYIGQKKKYKKDTAERIDSYLEYVKKKEVEIRNCRDREKEILNVIYHDTNEDIDIANNFDASLFDKIPEDEDFLEIYLGRGSVKAKREINYKKSESLVPDDELATIPDIITEKYEMLEECPITLKIDENRAIGVMGSKDKTDKLFRVMLIDIITRHYFGDVKVFLMLDDINNYTWAKAIPHVNEDYGRRNLVYDDESKNYIFEGLYKELARRSEVKNLDKAPYLIIFVKKNWGLNNHPISQYIEQANELKAAFIFFGETGPDIPLYCDTLIEMQDENRAKLISAKDGNNFHEFVYTDVTNQQMQDVSKILEPIYCQEISLESSLRKSISAFELFNIYSVDDIDLLNNWNKSEVWNTMAAPIGINSKNEIVTLNLHEKYHGPHGLVAGTTGSGKSEILQTYILSAAILYHPYEISFVIIDFKGGGMVNQFKDLPHLIGAITNIDGREIERSLKSIKAELLKRQNLFAEAGVNHIDKYIKMYKEGKVETPLPHLIIIVDEFAELKAEQPEFMKELISAARIGRSLGVHLILATQKPAGQVNEQIWSNSKFKLCLKVQTKEDSNEVLKSPLAAEIKEPGRAYLQVGNNELFELLQSGYSGASESDTSADDHAYSIAEVNFGGKRKVVFQKKPKKTESKRTQLEAIVEYIGEVCKKVNIEKLPNICLPSLAESIDILLDDRSDRGLGMSIGIYDDPDTQYQGDARINIANDNYMIIGSSASGKTNLLQVLIRQIASQYTPQEANIYIMDFGSMYLRIFDSLCYVGGVVTASEEEKLKNLFKLLLEEIARRKEAFLQLGISSYTAYEEGGFTELPRIFVFMDNYTVFRELYLDSYNDEFMFLIREGLSYGISVIMANSTTSGLGYRYLSNFGGRIVLYCNDSGEYTTLLERCRMKPREIPGRAIFSKDKNYYELQTYIAFEGEKEIDRSNAVKSFIEEQNSKYASVQARKIPEIPEFLTLKYMKDNFTISRTDYSYPVGLDYANVDTVNVDLREFNELAIVGNDEKIRMRVVMSLIRVMESYISANNIKMYIVDGINRALKEYSDKEFVSEYTLDVNKLEEIITRLEEICQERYNAIMNETEITDKSLHVVVINTFDAIDVVSGNKPLMERYIKIVKQFKAMGVCFIYSAIEDANIAYGAPEILKRLKDNKKALITTKKIKEVKFTDLPMGVIRNMKPLGASDAYLLKDSDVFRIKMVDD